MKIEAIKELVSQVIENMEAGVNPFWVKSWQGKSGFYNPITNNSYSGMNIFWLAFYNMFNQTNDNRFSTFKQLESLKIQFLPKGAKGVKLFFYSTVEKQSEDDKKTIIPILNGFTVFSWEQLTPEAKEKLNQKYFNQNSDEVLTADEQKAEDTLKKYLEIKGIKIVESTSAHFNDTKNIISMPNRASFVNNTEYIATIAHEVIHATGVADELNRKSLADYSSDISAKAEEELIAELGACLFCSYFGIAYTEQNNPKAYLTGYANVLKDNPKKIFNTLKSAAKAAEYIKNTVENN